MKKLMLAFIAMTNLTSCLLNCDISKQDYEALAEEYKSSFINSNEWGDKTYHIVSLYRFKQGLPTLIKVLSDHYSKEDEPIRLGSFGVTLRDCDTLSSIAYGLADCYNQLIRKNNKDIIEKIKREYPTESAMKIKSFIDIFTPKEIPNIKATHYFAKIMHLMVISKFLDVLWNKYGLEFEKNLKSLNAVSWGKNEPIQIKSNL